MGVQLPSEPITRKEQYLAKAAGQAVGIPAEPITREEAYLEAIANAGGGGGGTDDYNDLKNQPQIGGNTLIGNKSASDLGLVAEENGKGLSTNDFTDAYKTAIGDNTTAISGIKNGASINSFGGVESALADKADKSAVKNEFIGTLEQWNALTAEQKKAYDTYQITDDYSEALLPNYSTTAQKTGQKWIDGKDVYMVVYQPSSAVVVAKDNWTDIGMSASGIGMLLEITGIAADGACCAMVGAKDNNKIICLASRPDGAFTAAAFVMKYVEPSV